MNRLAVQQFLSPPVSGKVICGLNQIKEFVMKLILSLCLFSFGVSAGAQDLHQVRLGLNCEQTRAGCLVLQEPIIEHVSGTSGSFAHLLFEKLPVLDVDGLPPHGFSLLHGATIADGDKFISVTCELTPVRVLWSFCTFSHSYASDAAVVLTQVEFINLLAK